MKSKRNKIKALYQKIKSENEKSKTNSLNSDLWEEFKKRKQRHSVQYKKKRGESRVNYFRKKYIKTISLWYIKVFIVKSKNKLIFIYKIK